MIVKLMSNHPTVPHVLLWLLLFLLFLVVSHATAETLEGTTILRANTAVAGSTHVGVSEEARWRQQEYHDQGLSDRSRLDGINQNY